MHRRKRAVDWPGCQVRAPSTSTALLCTWALSLLLLAVSPLRPGSLPLRPPRDKGILDGAIGKAVRLRELRVRRYDVREAGCESSLDKSPCPSFTYCQASTPGHSRVPRMYFLGRVECVVRCKYKGECCTTPCGKVLFGPSYTIQARLLIPFRQTNH
jgi:hypothetical protein